MSSCMNFIPEFYNVFFVLFNFLIVLLTSFFQVPGGGCDFLKGGSSFSSMCLADIVHYLEDDDAGLDNVPLDSESEL